MCEMVKALNCISGNFAVERREAIEILAKKEEKQKENDFVIEVVPELRSTVKFG